MATRRNNKSESRASAAYPTEPSERGASAARLDVGSASQAADALLAPVNDVVPRARLANAEKQVGSRATGRRERSRSAVALDQYSAAVVRPLTGSAFVAPVGRASAQRGVSVKSPAGAPSSVVGADDDDDSESDVGAASTSMPPPSRAARSVPLRRSSAASSAVALNQAAASSPSDGFRIMVNGIACDLEAPRVIPDLLFGPRVLLLDATTQRLLLPNGIDHSVRVVPGREYTTVRLRGGAADVEGAGSFVEDRRLVPRSWPLDTVSAHYRAGASDFYANVPSVGEHIARYVQEAEAALSQQEVTLSSVTQQPPPPDDDNEPLVDPADVDLSHLPKEERRARRAELRQAYKKKRKEEKRRKRAAMGGRYHPLVVKLPTVREALKDHPATISAEQNAAFVALRDAFNEAATGFNRGASLRGSTAAASGTDASPSQRIRFRPGASQGHLAADDEDGPTSAEPSFVRNEAALRSWAASVVGRMHKDLTGLTVYTREHPNVGFGAALAAYHKLPADEKDKYTEMAKDINAAARELDDQARSQAVAGHGGGGAGGSGGGVAAAGMSGVHSFLGQTQTQLQSQRGRAVSADSGTSAESGESVLPPTASSSARGGPTQTQQQAQPKQRRRARTPQSDSTITPVRPAGRRHRSEQPPTAASGPPLFQGDSGPVGSGVFSQAQAMRAAIEARQSAAGPLVSAVSSANPTPRASTAFGAAAMSSGRMTAAASQGASTLGFLGSQLSQQDPHGGGDDNDGDDDDSFMW